MSTLHELTNDFQALLEMCQDPEVDQDMLRDTIEAVEGELEIKADGYAKVIQELEGKEEYLDKEIKRLSAKKNVVVNSISRIKRTLENAMIQTGKRKFKTDLFSFNIQKNPASLVIDDPDMIPNKYLIPQDPKVDKTGIKELLKTGELSWAHLEQGESLRIR